VSPTAPKNLFTDDFKAESYWWDTTGSGAAESQASRELPREVDVAIIGAGYTGLHTAIQTARGGRSTLLLDAEQVGWGCSSRNGGQVGTGLKPGLDALCRTYGASRGHEIFAEGARSLDWIGRFVSEEQLQCDYKVCGRFHAAHNTSQFNRLARAAEATANDPEGEAIVVSRTDQQEELGTDAYFGGIVYPRHASLNPARYVDGLQQLAQDAGAEIAEHTRVNGVEKDSRAFILHTSRGKVRAQQVAIATNGYTGTLTPWLRRRVIPIGSYIIATEPLPPTLMDRLMPRDRVVSDSRKVVYYYRPSPDRRRILFGGRVSHNETDPLVSAPLLHRDLAQVFPELASVRVSHSWLGFVAYTFDTLMHIGERDGMHYAMGYCGSGVAMASYLGMRMGQQIMGQAEGRTGFDDLPFPSRPLYTGRPWFLGASVMYYRFRDRLNI
jgi:glycine/D-amino acid oxidase-like deaminating enzyme